MGAGVGSLGYELILFIDTLRFLRNVLGYEGLIFLTAYIAFMPKGLKGGVKVWGLVNLMCFLVGGVCSGVFYCLNVGRFIGENLAWGFKNISALLLICCCLFSYIIIRVGVKVYENRVVRGREFFDVEVMLGGKKAAFKALADTGNVLRDPLNGRAVIVGEFEILKEILPEGDKLGENLWGYMEKQRERLNMSLVPFKSLGAENGMLFCFLPDRILIDGEAVFGAEIGVSPDRLSGDGSFRGLLNVELIMKGEGTADVCGAA